MREGFERSAREAHTTTGIATDQGKTSNMTALGLVAEALHSPCRCRDDDVPLALYASNVRAFAGRAGQAVRSVRTTPMHGSAVAAAPFEACGLSKPRATSLGTAGCARGRRTANASPSAAGRILDASTRGRIEVWARMRPSS